VSDLSPREHRPESLRAPTIDGNGKRRWIYPERRSGPRARRRAWLSAGLISLYGIVPFVKVSGNPLLRFDVLSNVVYVGGQSFRFADGYFLLFLLLTAALLLAFATSLWGRVWCGSACPQTVFVDWLVRPIEEAFEGPALRRRLNDEKPLNAIRLIRKAGKHLTFGIVIFLLSNVLLAYFVDTRVLWSWMLSSPTQHPHAFVWMALTFAALYFDLIWFREQFCAFLCPYARFQSVLIDSATPTVAFDYNRGEPRGRRRASGDCVDCGLCVRVCPTGIDIRQGIQLECIQCMRCADACDSVMTGLKRSKGLIRLASENELTTKNKGRFLRPRPLGYLVLLIANLSITAYLIGGRDPLKLTVLRQSPSPYVEIGSGRVANYFSLRAVNQTDHDARLKLILNKNVQTICSPCGQLIPRNEELSGHLVIIFDPELTPSSIALGWEGSESTIELPLLRR
jgi:cytochrome c oxidase accessory protein FixG